MISQPIIESSQQQNDVQEQDLQQGLDLIRATLMKKIAKKLKKQLLIDKKTDTFVTVLTTEQAVKGNESDKRSLEMQGSE